LFPTNNLSCILRFCFLYDGLCSHFALTDLPTLTKQFKNKCTSQYTVISIQFPPSPLNKWHLGRKCREK
jgi:hypothetical protein